MEKEKLHKNVNEYNSMTLDRLIGNFPLSEGVPAAEKKNWSNLVAHELNNPTQTQAFWVSFLLCLFTSNS